MLQNVAVKNFRCFTSLQLQPLARINLIAGMNNSGKTALLEAIYLYASEGDAEIAFEINRSRGIGLPRNMAKDVCSWLFHDRKTGEPVEITATNREGTSGKLRMWVFQRGNGAPLQPKVDDEAIRQLGQEVYQSGLPYLACHLASDSGERHWSSTLLDAPQSTPRRDMRPGERKSLLLGANYRFFPAYLEYFSQLELAGREEDVLQMLRIIQPDLQRVALLVVQGEAMLYGTVGKDFPVPLTFMGEGMRHLLAIILAIANVPGGVVLIDEIENGLHYSVMKKVWQAVAEAARKADVQVFATTHSYECIRAAHEAFAESGEYDFHLHRLDRAGDEIRVATYKQETLETALELAHEVR